MLFISNNINKILDKDKYKEFIDELCEKTKYLGD